MSLYWEGVRFIETTREATRPTRVSLKSSIFAAQGLKNKPIHLYALITEATKWSSVLSEIIETTNLLSSEKKLSPPLALLLCHDLLLSKHGIAAPKQHVLRQSVERHRARLGAALTRSRLKARVASLEQWRQQLEANHVSVQSQQDGGSRHPRWVRLNTLMAFTAQQIEAEVFSDWQCVDSLSSVLQPKDAHIPAHRKVYMHDPHIHNLIATPSGTDLTTTSAYKQGRIIFQDKASCFPATLLDPRSDGSIAGDVIDACSAPGNKTTHLTALLAAAVTEVSSESGEANDEKRRPKIFAVERDPTRSKTLQKMITTAGCTSSTCPVDVQPLPNQDFLRLSPNDPRFAEVSSILLDPSCSGSGIIGRDDGDVEDGPAEMNGPPLVLPRRAQNIPPIVSSKFKDKKRKRKDPSAQQPAAAIDVDEPPESLGSLADNDLTAPADREEKLQARLTSLSNFQLALLRHAFRFPFARRIVYSTCSVHWQENEGVVVRALASLSSSAGWRLLRREEQVDGMRTWERRGDIDAVRSAFASLSVEARDGTLTNEGTEVEEQTVRDVADSCLRCSKDPNKGEGTQGFFVVGFVRDIGASGVSSDSSGTQSSSREEMAMKGIAGIENEAIPQENEEDEWSGFISSASSA